MDILKSMVYPGRIIIIGTSPAGQRVVLYSITGRSPSSQARRLEIDTQAGSVFVKPTDEQTLKTGNPDLLVYPAIMWDSHNGVAVSNGKQTRDVENMLAADSNPLDVLVGSLSSWEYEPDDPNFTPRISGCVIKGGSAALSVLKRAADGSVQRNLFTVPEIAGAGSLVSTYTGENVNPLPSFAGEPKAVTIPWATADEAAAALYDLLGPAAGGDDYRVTAAALYYSQDGHATISVKNRHN